MQKHSISPSKAPYLTLYHTVSTKNCPATAVATVFFATATNQILKLNTTTQA